MPTVRKCLSALVLLISVLVLTSLVAFGNKPTPPPGRVHAERSAATASEYQEIAPRPRPQLAAAVPDPAQYLRDVARFVAGVIASRSHHTTTTTTRSSSNRPQRYASSNSEAVFFACVRRRESGGDYRAVNTHEGVWINGHYEHAAGAYQFLPTVWDNAARSAGRGDLVGVNPAKASPADQDAIAHYVYTTQGRRPWAGGNYAC